MIEDITLAVWDPDLHRGCLLKERLDMFAKREAALFSGDWEGTPCNDACFLSFDVCGELETRVARSARQAGETVFILLVADRNCNLTAMFRPKIRPSGVLFRPVQSVHLRDMLGEIAEEMDRLARTETDDAFIFKSDGASRRIPFRDILFFEACNKKVVLHTTGQEIGYYDSIDNLASVLPPNFVRCHRSFLVNVRKIEELRGADMVLKLVGGVCIPFSRSQRSAVEKQLTINS
ncbi:MAG: LytTR family transcriptional regulator DNA-binding domain-containing protein [Oscillospiraceae bacterium]|nr:LytTR family transcriptional regulator DNA-binding domain-containing protein [Oscillospiraceae bacterium]